MSVSSINNKVRILALTTTFPPILTTGGSVYYQYLAEGVKKHKDISTFIVLTEAVKGCKRIESEENNTIFRLLLPQGKKGRTQQRSRFGKALIFLSNQVIQLIAVPVLIMWYRIDVLHIHAALLNLGRFEKINPFFYNLLLLLRKIYTVAVLIDSRGVSVCSEKHQKFDSIVCCAENTIERYRELGINREILNLVPIPFISPCIKDGLPLILQNLKPYICFVGRMESSKGIYELIDAFQMLKFTKNASLVLVGINLEGEKFTNYILEDKDIHYLGPKLQDEALQIITYADLFILPSKSEGLPRSCLEAMALGTKVVLPPGIPEFNKYCSEFVLSEITTEALKEKMNQVLQQGKTAKYPFEFHYPEIVVNSMVDIYKKINRKKGSK